MKKTAAEIHALAVDLMKVGQFQEADRLFKAHEAMRLVKADEESQKQVVLDLLHKLYALDKYDEMPGTAQVVMDALMEMGDPKAAQVAKNLGAALKNDDANHTALADAAREGEDIIKGIKEVSPYDLMQTWLDGNLTRFPKDRQGAWWDPPHNYCINSALMGLNTWQFHILPRMRQPLHYPPSLGMSKEETDNLQPDGIIIDPGWWPTTSSDPTNGDTVDHSVKVAEILAKFAKGQPSVQQTVKNELTWLEGKYKVMIPPAIEASLIKDALKVATRRWGVNRLRTKKILVPFDGSKAQEMSNW
jgi:hypothetical protein